MRYENDRLSQWEGLDSLSNSVGMLLPIGSVLRLAAPKGGYDYLDLPTLKLLGY